MEIEFKQSVFSDELFRMKITLENGTSIQIPALERKEIEQIYNATRSFLQRTEKNPASGAYRYNPKTKRLERIE